MKVRYAPTIPWIAWSLTWPMVAARPSPGWVVQVQVNAVLKDLARFSSELVPQRAKFTAGLVAAARAAFKAALKAPDIARLKRDRE